MDAGVDDIRPGDGGVKDFVPPPDGQPDICPGGAADQGNRLLVAGFGNLLPLDSDNLVPRFQNPFGRRTVAEIEDSQSILFILADSDADAAHIAVVVILKRFILLRRAVDAVLVEGVGQPSCRRVGRVLGVDIKQVVGVNQFFQLGNFSCHLGRNRRCPLPEAPELLSAEGKDAPQHKSRRQSR